MWTWTMLRVPTICRTVGFPFDSYDGQRGTTSMDDWCHLISYTFQEGVKDLISFGFIRK